MPPTTFEGVSVEIHSHNGRAIFLETTLVCWWVFLSATRHPFIVSFLVSKGHQTHTTLLGRFPFETNPFGGSSRKKAHMVCSDIFCLGVPTTPEPGKNDDLGWPNPHPPGLKGT